MGGQVERVPAQEHLSWVRSFGADEPEARGVHRVGELLPDGLERYLRVFHPWTQSSDCGSPGQRTWKELADEAGVVYHAELQARSLGAVNAMHDGKRPYGTAEGYLDPEVRERLVLALVDDPRVPVLVLFGLAAMTSGGETMVFRGAAKDLETICAAATAEVPLPIGERPLPAEKIWAVDRSWMVATEWDLHSTYVAASSVAANRVERDPHLETAAVTRSTRVDGGSDLVNAAGYEIRPG